MNSSETFAKVNLSHNDDGNNRVAFAAAGQTGTADVTPTYIPVCVKVRIPVGVINALNKLILQ